SCCKCSRSFTNHLFLFGCTWTGDCTRAGDASSRTENRRGMEKDLEICCKCGSAQPDCLYFSAYCDDFYPSQLCCSGAGIDRKSTRLNSSHVSSSYAVCCFK